MALFWLEFDGIISEFKELLFRIVPSKEIP